MKASQERERPENVTLQSLTLPARQPYVTSEQGNEGLALIPIVRLLPSAAADGPTNMARDEVLLLAAVDGIASLRFYCWNEPTLSLGYFQQHAARLADSRLADVPFVRRASGGGAILHDRELTYCLALPRGSTWHSSESWLCRFHGVVAAALERFGVRSRSVICGEEKGAGEFLCFLHQTPGDLVISTAKVVGSAQRRQRGALMQHGSILFEQSPPTPALPGIGEMSNIVIVAAAAERAIVAEFRSRTGWNIEPADWKAEELVQVEQLRVGKYATSEWNRKR